MNIFRFKYIKGPILTYELVKWIVSKCSNSCRVSLDLGLSSCNVSVSEGFIDLCGFARISIDELDLVKPGFIYKVLKNSIVRIDHFDSSLNKYYKLKPIGIDKAPTLEINGIQMHRAVDTDPWSDSKIKVKRLGNLNGKKVLDICTGLGYTASLELMHGASKVLTVEIDANVLRIAEMNPWSRYLENAKIVILNDDIFNVLPSINDEYFDRILHDPPRINVAGELYSRELYRELYRVLKSRGILFHYTGEPSKHGNVSYLKGIKNRLQSSGFSHISWDHRSKGFIAYKT